MTLAKIHLGLCYWNITDLNVQIIQSVIPEMRLNIIGSNKTNVQKTLIQDMPFVHVFNTSIQHFHGIGIHLQMFSSVTIVDTSTLGPLITLQSSIADITSSKFQGVVGREQNPRAFATGNKSDSSTDFKYDAMCFNLKYSTGTFDDCVFENIQVELVGYLMSPVLCALNSYVDIQKSIFRNNSGGLPSVYLRTSHGNITDSMFLYNFGSISGAVTVEGYLNPYLMIENAIFKYNGAIANGACITVAGSTAYITDSLFQNNTGLSEQTIYLQYKSHLIAHRCKFYDNHMNRSSFRNDGIPYNITNNNRLVPSGVRVSKLERQPQNLLGETLKPDAHLQDNSFSVITGTINVAIDLQHCEFISNKGQGIGGALGLFSRSAATITSCLFKDNSAYQGGALNIQTGSSTSVINSTFIGNSADGGGAVCAIKDVTLFLKRCVFEGNKARIGAAVVSGSDVNVTITDCIFRNNIATQAVAVIYAEAKSNLTMQECMLSNNKAPKHGTIFLKGSSYFAISMTHLNSSELTVESSELMISGCTLSFGARISATGKSILHIENSNFTNNKVNSLIQSDAAVVINRCILTDNTVTNNGGLIIVTHNILVIRDSVFVNNNGVMISSGNLSIVSSYFAHNNMHDMEGLGQGLIYVTEKQHAFMQVISTAFTYNSGTLIKAFSAVNVIFDSCNIKGNTGGKGTVDLLDVSTLSISNTSFHTEDRQVAILFETSDKRTKMTDFLTFETYFISGKTTLTSSNTDNLLQKLVAVGIVEVFYRIVGYHVTQEETPYASGLYIYR